MACYSSLGDSDDGNCPNSLFVVCSLYRRRLFPLSLFFLFLFLFFILFFDWGEGSIPLFFISN